MSVLQLLTLRRTRTWTHGAGRILAAAATAILLAARAMVTLHEHAMHLECCVRAGACTDPSSTLKEYSPSDPSFACSSDVFDGWGYGTTDFSNFPYLQGRNTTEVCCLSRLVTAL